jgi:HPt (histidine-containing phosphotransfer) domain-containing protein
MMEIVREFACELPDRVTALETCLIEGDLAQLQTLAHQLKGAGGGYGFAQISEAAGTLEQALKDAADASVIKQQTDGLCDTLRSVEVSEAD